MSYILFGNNAAAPAAPSLASGIYAHWDASGLVDDTTNGYGIVSGGAISQLTDRSGNGRHMVQGTGANQPALASGVINSLNAAQFSGSQFLVNTTKADWQFLSSRWATVLCIVRFDGTGLYSWFGNAYNATNLGFMFRWNNSQIQYYLARGVASYANSPNSGGDAAASSFHLLRHQQHYPHSGVLAATNPHVIVQACSHGLLASAATTGSIILVNSTYDLQIGAINGTTFEPMTGYVAEIVVWNDVLEGEDLSNSVLSLLDKFAL